MKGERDLRTPRQSIHIPRSLGSLVAAGVIGLGTIGCSGTESSPPETTATTEINTVPFRIEMGELAQTDPFEAFRRLVGDDQVPGAVFGFEHTPYGATLGTLLKNAEAIRGQKPITHTRADGTVETNPDGNREFIIVDDAERSRYVYGRGNAFFRITQDSEGNMTNIAAITTDPASTSGYPTGSLEVSLKGKSVDAVVAATYDVGTEWNPAWPFPQVPAGETDALEEIVARIMQSDSPLSECSFQSGSAEVGPDEKGEMLSVAVRQVVFCR